MDAEIRQRVWWLYGWFCGLMCCGSCVGAVTWAARMEFLLLLFGPLPTDLNNAGYWNLELQRCRWLGLFFSLYAVAFFCLSVAKLMVLDRMTDFASMKTTRLWVFVGRFVIGVVVAANTVGLASCIWASVLLKEAGDLTGAAAALFAASRSDTEEYRQTADSYHQKVQLAYDTSSVQKFCEVAVLLLIIVAFTVAGVACSRILTSIMRESNHEVEATSRRVRRQIVVTVAFIFATFLLRAIFSIMDALAEALENRGTVTVTSCKHYTGACDDDECYNVYTLILYWLMYTPEYQLSVVLISSPLALLVALWGMTSDRTLQLMRSSQQQISLAQMLEYPGNS